ncbi:hypothetical protein F5Y06DRAFT_297266 [Hypoxylon sp. FL0890]|nr:hypothetical protein F5Y06DRAFT_297266 [Hypoxylon sp. FL0890]
MTDVLLTDCIHNNERLSQAAYYQTYTDATAKDSAEVSPSSQDHIWENAESWAYFTDTGTNFTANLGPEGSNGDFAGTAYNGYVHFVCFQQPETYVYNSGGVGCYQRYNCSHAAIPSTITASSPLSSSSFSSSTRSKTSLSSDSASISTTSTDSLLSSSVSSTTVSTTSPSSTSVPSTPIVSTTSESSSSASLPPVRITSLSPNSTSSPTVSTTSSPPNSTSPPPSNNDKSLSKTQVIGLVVGVALGVLAVVGLGAFAVWKWRKWKGTKKAAKPPDEQSSDTSEEKPDTSQMVEADGFPAGSELDAPLPVRELDGRSRPAEIHGVPLAELEGTRGQGWL